MAGKTKTTLFSPPEVTIFDNVYRTMFQKLSELIIPAINEAFGTSYDMDADLTQLRNEHLELAGKIITDSIFRIDDKLYHLECQSTHDGQMAIRMFEHDVAIDLEAACKGKDADVVNRFTATNQAYSRPFAANQISLSISLSHPYGSETPPCPAPQRFPPPCQPSFSSARSRA